MPTITKIEIQKKREDRANLYLDDKFYCRINLEIVVKNHLKKDMNITCEKLEQLILDDEKSSAFDKALKYIGSSLKTTKQIKDYLNKREYNRCTIDYVIDKLNEYKYIDDYHYAEAFVSTYSSKYGKLKLISALRSKGINQNIIDDVFAEGMELKSSIDIVAAKYLKNKEINRETLNKLCRFLCSRGYEFDEINSLINKLKED